MSWPAGARALLEKGAQGFEYPADAAEVSMAISLKRIADALEGRPAAGEVGKPGFDGGRLGLVDYLGEVLQRVLSRELGR